MSSVSFIQPSLVCFLCFDEEIARLINQADAPKDVVVQDLASHVSKTPNNGIAKTDHVNQPSSVPSEVIDEIICRLFIPALGASRFACRTFSSTIMTSSTTLSNILSDVALTVIHYHPACFEKQCVCWQRPNVLKLNEPDFGSYPSSLAKVPRFCC